MTRIRWLLVTVLLLSAVWFSIYALRILGPSSSQTTTVSNPIAEEVCKLRAQSTSSSESSTSSSQTCTYLIFADGTTTYAQNCNTGALDYSGTAPQTVISTAISALTKGGAVVLKAGTYVITNQIQIGASNIVFEGEGNKTVISVSNGGAYIPISVTGNRVVLRSFKLDATGQAKNQSLPGILVQGSNDTLTGLTITQVDHGGIDIRGTYTHVFGNSLYDQHDDGIIVRGAFNTVRDNIINGNQRFNGISFASALNATAYGNTISNIHSGNGIGIENMGAGRCKDIVISHNLISNVAAYGVNFYQKFNASYAETAENVDIFGNTIRQCGRGGILVVSTGAGQVNIHGNTLIDDAGAAKGTVGVVTLGTEGVVNYKLAVTNNIIMVSNNTVSGVYVTMANSTIISGNTIVYPKANPVLGMTGIYVTHAYRVVITANHIKYAYRGILIHNNVNDTIVDSNLIEDPANAGIYLMTNVTRFNVTWNYVRGASLSGDGIVLYNSVRQGLVSGNVVFGSEKASETPYCILTTENVQNVTITNNYVNYCTNGIVEGTGSDYNLIGANFIGASVTTPLNLTGTHTKAFANSGFNPQAAASISVDGSSFTYTNNDGYPELVIVSGGTVGDISYVRGATTTSTGLTSGSFLLCPGEGLRVTYSSTPTMVKFPE